MKKFLNILVVIVIASFIFTGCKLFGPKTEKDSFVEATIKVTCLIFESDSLVDQELNNKAKEIYRDYGFPVDDEAKMKELSGLYSVDAEAQSAITAGIQKKCGSKVPDMFKDSLSIPATTPSTDVPAEGSAQ
jgi:hypothetical protein